VLGGTSEFFDLSAIKSPFAKAGTLSPKSRLLGWNGEELPEWLSSRFRQFHNSRNFRTNLACSSRSSSWSTSWLYLPFHRPKLVKSERRALEGFEAALCSLLPVLPEKKDLNLIRI
jgi:hypothetical protein